MSNRYKKVGSKRRVSVAKHAESMSSVEVESGDGFNKVLNFTLSYIRIFNIFCQNNLSMYTALPVTKARTIDLTASWLKKNGSCFKHFLKIVQTCLNDDGNLNIEACDEYLKQHPSFVSKFDSQSFALMLQFFSLYPDEPNPSIDTVVEYFKLLWDTLSLYENSGLSAREVKIDFNSGSINSSLLGRL